MGESSEERHRRALEVEPVVRRVICARALDPSLPTSSKTPWCDCCRLRRS